MKNIRLTQYYSLSILYTQYIIYKIIDLIIKITQFIPDLNISTSSFYGRKISKTLCRQNIGIIDIGEHSDESDSDGEGSNIDKSKNYADLLDSKLQYDSVIIDLPPEALTVFDHSDIETALHNQDLSVIETDEAEISTIDKEVTDNISSSFNQKKKRNNFLWKNKENIVYNLEKFESNRFAFSDIENLDSPSDLFNYFIDDQILQEIVFQSNLYAMQNNINKPLDLSVAELRRWIGLLFYFSIAPLPQTRMHWSTNLPEQLEFAAKIMSRDRFEQIKRYLHLSDNDNAVQGDKMNKVRPLINHLKEKFNTIPKPENMCIDEQIVPFKGRHSSKQYMPNKPKKWGFKLFVLADSGGVIHDIYPYCGKIPPVHRDDVPDLGASSNIVLHLAESIPYNRNHKLYFDNWFSSLPLMDYLASHKVWCCGTIRTNRIPSLKIKENKTKERGESVQWETNVSTNIAVVTWFDNKPVHLASTFLQVEPQQEIERYNKNSKNFVTIKRPNIVTEYNKNMGGVDLADMLLSLYRIPVRSKKYYHRLVFHLLDIALINAWLLYRRYFISSRMVKDRCISLLLFKLDVVNSLTYYRPIIKRGRPSTSAAGIMESPTLPKTIRQKRPHSCISKDNYDHLPEYIEKQMRCKNYNCSGRTNVQCIKCKISLCFTPKRNCFRDFHK